MKRALFYLRATLCLLSLFGFGAASGQNVIQTENAKPGTTDWQIIAVDTNPTIFGYASATSVNRGETIRFFVSSWASTYTLAIYRLGWYGGTGGRLMTSVSLPGTVQGCPAPDVNTGLVDCNWSESWRLTVPGSSDKTDWASGIYVAKLTPSAGTGGYIIFVVRDDSSRSAYVYQNAATTLQAYNNFGGKSLYAYNSDNSAPARKVSFNRPYGCDGNICGAAQLFKWEINFVRFVEREGYDVTYISNVDLHTNPGLLLNHRALLIPGHDEYWTYQMKAAAHNAQAQGIHLGFFSANEAYWQIRFEPSASGQPNRTIVAYKEAAQTADPFARDADASNNKFITTRFRDLQPLFGVTDSVATPENGLVGVMYHGDPFSGDIIVSDSTNWVYRATGVSNGTRLNGMLGYETDSAFDNGFSPPQLRKIAQSPDPWAFSHVATYTTPVGAIVFATGSMQWNWGLDNYGSRNLENEAVKQATRNVLARFAAPPLAMPGFVTAKSTFQAIDLGWAASAGASSYNIYRGQTAGGEGTLPYRSGITSTSFTDTDIGGGGTFYYRVTAVNSATESALSAEVSAAGPPAPPSGLSGSTAETNIKLGWTQSATPSIGGNRVYRATSANGPFSLVASLAPSTNYMDNKVQRGTTYFYAVTAVSASGSESAYSNIYSQTVK
jgi:hypothetical protein